MILAETIALRQPDFPAFDLYSPMPDFWFLVFQSFLSLLLVGAVVGLWRLLPRLDAWRARLALNRDAWLGSIRTSRQRLREADRLMHAVESGIGTLLKPPLTFQGRLLRLAYRILVRA